MFIIFISGSSVLPISDALILSHVMSVSPEFTRISLPIFKSRHKDWE